MRVTRVTVRAEGAEREDLDLRRTSLRSSRIRPTSPLTAPDLPATMTSPVNASLIACCCCCRFPRARSRWVASVHLLTTKPKRIEGPRETSRAFFFLEKGSANGVKDSVIRELEGSVNRAEFEALADSLADSAPHEILARAVDRFPRITFATGFGVEGCLLIDLIARYDLHIDVFTLDTGLLFPETYALWRRLEERYRVTIRACVRRERSCSRRRNSATASGSASRNAAAECERSFRSPRRSRRSKRG